MALMRSLLACHRLLLPLFLLPWLLLLLTLVSMGIVTLVVVVDRSELTVTSTETCMS